MLRPQSNANPVINMLLVRRESPKYPQNALRYAFPPTPCNVMPQSRPKTHTREDVQLAETSSRPLELGERIFKLAYPLVLLPQLLLQSPLRVLVLSF